MRERERFMAMYEKSLMLYIEKYHYMKGKAPADLEFADDVIVEGIFEIMFNCQLTNWIAEKHESKENFCVEILEKMKGLRKEPKRPLFKMEKIVKFTGMKKALEKRTLFFLYEMILKNMKWKKYSEYFGRVKPKKQKGKIQASSLLIADFKKKLKSQTQLGKNLGVAGTKGKDTKYQKIMRSMTQMNKKNSKNQNNLLASQLTIQSKEQDSGLNLQDSIDLDNLELEKSKSYAFDIELKKSCFMSKKSVSMLASVQIMKKDDVEPKFSKNVQGIFDRQAIMPHFEIKIDEKLMMTIVLTVIEYCKRNTKEVEGLRQMAFM